jgi:hypothetical protein
MSDEEPNLPVPSEGMDMAEVAYLMRRQGLSPSDIATELHTTPAVIYQAVQRRLTHEAQLLGDEERQMLLALENARLDHYLSKIWAQIDYGDLKAIETALKITRERAKLNQMDMPTSTNTTQVLVVGGEAVSYIDALKSVVDG